MSDPSERDQFHTAICGHAAGTCGTCDTVRASGVFTRNGRRPMVTGRFRPATVMPDQPVIATVIKALPANACPVCNKNHREGTRIIARHAAELTGRGYLGYDYDTEAWHITRSETP